MILIQLRIKSNSPIEHLQKMFRQYSSSDLATQLNNICANSREKVLWNNVWKTNPSKRASSLNNCISLTCTMEKRETQTFGQSKCVVLSLSTKLEKTHCYVFLDNFLTALNFSINVYCFHLVQSWKKPLLCVFR